MPLVTTLERPEAEGRTFNKGFAAWTLALVLLFFGGLGILSAAGRLPPPPLTTTACMDSKFAFMNEMPRRDPTLLAVGSSVTLHDLDFGMLERRYPAIRPLNGATCYMYVNQTFFLTRFYVEHFPTVDTVLSVFAMRDFEACTTNPTEFFDTGDARRYVAEQWPGWYLYFKNFDPLSFGRKIIQGPLPAEDRNFDAYGSAPLVTDGPDASHDISRDETCFGYLRKLSDFLAARHVRFIVVLMPELPGWAAQFDPVHQRDQAFRAAVAASLTTGSTVLIDVSGLRLDDRHFTDPAHLQWGSVPILMDYLMSELERRQIAVAAPRSAE